MSEERFSSLAFSHIYRDILLNLDDVIERFEIIWYWIKKKKGSIDLIL